MSSTHQQWLDSLEIGKNPCKKCRSKGNDRSGDNFHFYGKGKGGYCNACGYTIPSDDVKKENKKYGSTRSKPRFMECEIKVMAKEFTEDDWGELLEVSTYDPNGFRGLKESTCEDYQVVHTYSEETGEIEGQWYPSTKNTELVGCKARKVPKDFYFQGQTGNDLDLFGQWLYVNSNSNWVVITGGEIDALSAHQILEVNKKKGFETIPVVSPINGETGAHKQLKNHYEWLNTFEKIFLCFDNDQAGVKATEDAVKVLPKGKVYIIKMSRKDVNEYIWDNDKGKPVNHSQEWYNAFWRAEKYVPAGVLGSNTLYDVILDKANVDRISLPVFAKKLQDMMSGGIPLKSIVNISAACVDGDTEYFNGRGWKSIKDYKEGDLVGQYNDRGELELVTPLNYIKEPCDKMTRISTGRGLDQVCSDDHNFAYWQPHKKDDPSAYKKMPFKELIEEHKSRKSGFNRGSVKTVFSYGGQGIDFTEGELRLQVAIMADGRVVKEGKDNYTQMRFRKERKYLRLKQLCEKFDLKYSDRGINNQDCFEIIVWGKTSDKHFTEDYYNCTNEQLAIIIDELKYWDGSVNTEAFSTTSKESADFIQFAFASLGRRATISLDSRSDKYKEGYCATVHPTKNAFVGLVGGGSPVSKGAVVEEYKTKDGFKYCFEVPSSLLVLRRNGKIFITSNSGIGKTVYINEFVLHWIFNTPFKVGVCSLEADVAEYGENLLSRYSGKKISLFSNKEEKIEYLKKEDVKEKALELFQDSEGLPRFYINDDRGDFDSLTSKIEQMVISCGVQILVIDPTSDALAGLSNEEVDLFMQWQKKLTKSHDVTIINIMHSRKGSADKKAGSEGGKLTEESIIGASSQYKSASANILLSRNKMEEDEFLRNITYLGLPKCRWTGNTGPAGKVFYENSTHTCHDLDTYLEDHPEFKNKFKDDYKPKETKSPKKFTMEKK